MITAMEMRIKITKMMIVIMLIRRIKKYPGIMMLMLTVMLTLLIKTDHDDAYKKKIKR